MDLKCASYKKDLSCLLNFPINSFFICIVFSLFANICTTRAKDNFVFMNLMTDSEWEHQNIYALAKDSNGFMWFGTDNGLYQYDGYQYKYYSQPDLIGNSISDLFMSSKGLLIGTSYGLCMYDRYSDTFNIIQLKEKSQSGDHTPVVKVRTIYQACDKYYIGTNNGVYVLNSELENESHLLFANNAQSINSNIVRAIFADNKGYIWFGTYNGVYRYSPSSQTLEFIKTIERKLSDPLNNLVLSFESVPYDDSLLLIGQETGLTILNTNTLEYKVLRKETSCDLSNNSIKTVRHLYDDFFMLGTDNGLNVLNLRNNDVISYFHEIENKYSIAGNVISDICVDSSNNMVWLATNKGVSKIDLNQRITAELSVYTKNSLYFNMHDILCEPCGDVWITTTNGLLLLENGKITKKIGTLDGLMHNNSSVLFQDKQGIIWVGTLNGLNYIEKKEVKAIGGPDNDIKYIRGIHQSSDGKIWIVDHVGLSYITSEKEKYVLSRIPSSNSAFDNTTEIYISGLKDSTIWLGTNMGLYTFDTAKNEWKLIDNSVEAKGITAMAIHGDMLVWGTAFGLHFYNINKQTKEPFSLAGRRLSVFDIMVDNENFWIVAKKNLFRYDVTTGEIFEYDYINDIPFGGEIPQCSYYRDGKILLGGYGKYISFQKEDISNRVNMAPVRITDFVLNDSQGTKKNIYSPIFIEYDNNNFTINFSLLTYDNSTSNKYAYRLSGYENEWKYVTDDLHSVTYNNIPPGKYVFEVRGANSDSQWSLNKDELEIYINGPWWTNPWAYVIYILALLFIVILIIHFVKLRIRFLEKRQVERLKLENLRELNLMRMQFFANVSHEFKTPLSLILGPVEVISEELSSSEPLLSQLHILQKNVQRLRRLVEQIMSLCKLESKEMVVNLQIGDLVQFARNVFEIFQTQATQHGILFRFNTELESVSMMFDEDKMEQILYNLLDNAFKFTPDGGSIELEIVKEDFLQDIICIRVKDSGIGIPSEDMERIFDKFYQGKNTSLMDKRGTGIGLSIVKQFVEMQGGSITIDSKIGEGSNFSLFFSVISSFQKVELQSDVSFGKPTLLVAEDNSDMREYIKLNLQTEYNILEANDGGVAWEMIKAYIPDVIISDILMPQMDGLELCRKVRAEFQTEHIPIILLTAMPADLRLKESLEAGANSYITKPFSIKVLRLKIGAILADRKRMQEKIRIQVLQQPASVIQESRDEQFIHDFVKAVEAHIDDPELDVELICCKLGFSHQQTYRKINAITGKNINSFIRYIRINRSAQLLRDTDMNISEIMDHIGVSNRTYFYKVFKEEFGMAPLEYKNKFSSSM